MTKAELIEALAELPDDAEIFIEGVRLCGDVEIHLNSEDWYHHRHHQDPRYNNVEIYHGTPYGLSLKHILAQRDQLTEALIPELHLAIPELFALSEEES